MYRERFSNRSSFWRASSDRRTATTFFLPVRGRPAPGRFPPRLDFFSFIFNSPFRNGTQKALHMVAHTNLLMRKNHNRIRKRADFSLLLIFPYLLSYSVNNVRYSVFFQPFTISPCSCIAVEGFGAMRPKTSPFDFNSKSHIFQFKFKLKFCVPFPPTGSVHVVSMSKTPFLLHYKDTNNI